MEFFLKQGLQNLQVALLFDITRKILVKQKVEKTKRKKMENKIMDE